VPTPGESSSSQGSLSAKGRSGAPYPWALVSKGPTSRPEQESEVKIGETSVLVEVELSGPGSSSMLSHLGSLTERHGMALYPRGPLSSGEEPLRVSVAVPRARTPDEAEEVVAHMLATVDPTGASGAPRRRRDVVHSRPNIPPKRTNPKPS
jgi:hypothetical protein